MSLLRGLLMNNHLKEFRGKAKNIRIVEKKKSSFNIRPKQVGSAIYQCFQKYTGRGII